MKHLTKLLIVTVMLTFVLALPLGAQDEVQTNKTVVMDYLNFVYNQMNLDGASILLAEDMVFNDPVWGALDINGFEENYQLFYDRVQDIKITSYAMIGDGDIVAVPYLWEATESTYGVDTVNQPLSGNGVEFFRVLDGKIVEVWRQFEEHEFSILGTAEDYRSQIRMLVNVPSLVETTGIPALTDALHTSSLVETTGIPDTIAPTAETIMIPAQVNVPSLVETTGIPALTNVYLMPNMAQDDTSIVLHWIDAYNRGSLDINLMSPNFLQHNCPVNRLGIVDLPTFANNVERLKADGRFLPWTPISHSFGFTAVSEGGLTAILYDVHSAGFVEHPTGISIFRLENGKIAEQWTF